MRWRWAVRLLAIVATATIAVVLSGAKLPLTAEQQQVADVARGAVNAEVAATIAPPSIPTSRPLTEKEALALRPVVVARLARYFAGPRLALLASRMKAAVMPDTVGGAWRKIAGGVDDFAVQQISINGDSAHVDSTGRAWTTDITYPDSVTEGPKTIGGHVIYHLGLTRTAGQWYVTEETREFAPGEGP